jgi:hypothetical protein
LTQKQTLSRADLTTGYTELDTPAVTEVVHEPREDSQLLVDMMEKAGDDQTSSERTPR